MLKVGIIGTGYWGKHYLRIFSKLDCELVGVADIDTRKEKLAKEYKVAFYTDYKKLLKKVDAVSIVTPPVTHYAIAKKALRYGKHVLLEKPFVFRKKEAIELQKTAGSKLILMAGHTYLYHPAIIRLRELFRRNDLGYVYYLLLQWFNLGIVRFDVNALWNFAPHPFSILYFLLEKLPQEVTAYGRAFIQSGIEDAVFLNLSYQNNLAVQVNLSWLHPLKIREVTIVGSKKLVHFDDTSLDTPLKIYEKGISPEEFRQYSNWENYAEFKSKSRYGGVEIPHIDEVEPLELELKDFLQAAAGKRKPVADINSALAVVALLETAQKSLDKGGKPIAVKSY